MRVCLFQPEEGREQSLVDILAQPRTSQNLYAAGGLPGFQEPPTSLDRATVLSLPLFSESPDVRVNSPADRHEPGPFQCMPERTWDRRQLVAESIRPPSLVPAPLNLFRTGSGDSFLKGRSPTHQDCDSCPEVANHEEDLISITDTEPANFPSINPIP
jgi:hypothetical protein